MCCLSGRNNAHIYRDKIGPGILQIKIIIMTDYISHFYLITSTLTWISRKMECDMETRIRVMQIVPATYNPPPAIHDH